MNKRDRKEWQTFCQTLAQFPLKSLAEIILLYWRYWDCYVFTEFLVNPVNLVITKKIIVLMLFVCWCCLCVDVVCVAPRWEDYKRQVAPAQAYIFYHLRSAFLSRIGKCFFYCINIHCWNEYIEMGNVVHGEKFQIGLISKVEGGDSECKMLVIPSIFNLNFG